MSEAMLRLKYVAQVLGINPRYVSDFVKRNNIPVKRISSKLVYVTKENLDAFIEKQNKDLSKKAGGKTNGHKKNKGKHNAKGN
jgi:hypothetical protein